MTLALDHVQLAIPQGGEAVARSFWGGILGLEEIGKPAPLKARGGCWFRLDGQEFHLGVERDFVPARKAHPAFLTRDLDGLAARLSNVTWDTALPDRRRFFTEDPFGNRLEFVAQT